MDAVAAKDQDRERGEATETSGAPAGGAGCASDRRRACAPCACCGAELPIVAKGKCRRCYDRDRVCAGAGYSVEAGGQLSDEERAVVRAAFAHHLKHGEYPCLLDLVHRLAPMAPRDVARAAFGAIRCGSASFRFAPIRRKGPKVAQQTTPTDTRNHSGIGGK